MIPDNLENFPLSDTDFLFTLTPNCKRSTGYDDVIVGADTEKPTSMNCHVIKEEEPFFSIIGEGSHHDGSDCEYFPQHYRRYVTPPRMWVNSHNKKSKQK